MTSNDSDSNQSHFDSSERSPANGKMPAYCETTVSRREFIGITAGSLLMGGMLGAAGKPEGKNGIPHRTLGRTGETVSVIGLGGYHLGKQSDPDESIRIIRTGIDEGRNQFSRQLLGLQRRRERNSDGQSVTRWLSSKSLFDDQDRWPK